MRRYPVDKVRVTPRGAYRFDRGAVIHYGVDLGGARGTEVLAPEAGVIVARFVNVTTGRPYRKQDRPWNGYGPCGVVILGVSGRYHVLAHLLEADLAPLGAVVTAGQLVGRMSGLRHVHWEVRAAMTDGASTISPVAWLEEKPSTVPTPPKAPRATPASGWLIVAALAAAVLISRRLRA